MEKRIRAKTSRTAEIKCLERALSYYEKNKLYRSDDYVAPVIMPFFLKGLAKLSVLGYFYRLFTVKGVYEYVIARTKYIDEAFDKNLENAEQVLIFGAGFDSRSIRFKDKTKHAKYFELDSTITQNARIKRFKEMNIEVPPNVVFIPIDFDKDSLSQKLDEYGFKRNKVCLFLLEGLTMYLDPRSIDATFKLISGYAGKDSIVIFDYIYASVTRRENLYDGEKELYDAVSKAGEKFTFGIERGKIEEFLSKYDLSLVEEVTADVLEKRYFTDQEGKVVGRVTGTHSLVLSKK